MIDPLNRESRDVILNLIPAGASVLDIGCGTGLLCFEFRRQKGCRVVGADLSLRMINFAKDHNSYDDVRFIHQDATDLNEVEDNSFDYTVSSLIIHELYPEAQQKLVKEAWRVGSKCLYVESNVPLPWNLSGLIKRFFEVSFGFDHYSQFKAYLASGGLMSILSRAGLGDKVIHREIYTMNSNQVVIVAH